MNRFGRKSAAIFNIAVVMLFLAQNAAAENNYFTPECNNPQYVVMPQYNPTSGSIFANVPSVTIYTNKFLEAVYASDNLRRAFDLSQMPAAEFVDYATIYGKNYIQSKGVENADELMEFEFRGIRQNFQVLTLPVMARTYANAAANFLYTEGVLRIDNAEYLASEYARALEDSAKFGLNSDPTSKFPVLLDGFINYFTSLGMTTKEKIPFLMFYVANEWFIAAINYRWF